MAAHKVDATLGTLFVESEYRDSIRSFALELLVLLDVELEQEVKVDAGKDQKRKVVDEERNPRFELPTEVVLDVLLHEVLEPVLSELQHRQCKRKANLQLLAVHSTMLVEFRRAPDENVGALDAAVNELERRLRRYAGPPAPS